MTTPVTCHVCGAIAAATYPDGSAFCNTHDPERTGRRPYKFDWAKINEPNAPFFRKQAREDLDYLWNKRKDEGASEEELKELREAIDEYDPMQQRHYPETIIRSLMRANFD